LEAGSAIRDKRPLSGRCCKVKHICAESLNNDSHPKSISFRIECQTVARLHTHVCTPTWGRRLPKKCKSSILSGLPQASRHLSTASGATHPTGRDFLGLVCLSSRNFMRTVVEKLWTLGTSKRLVAMAAILLGAGTIILTSYALVIRARAEALRKDIRTLKAGASTE
jgi:hypothetical protein